jgi:Glycosyltransferase family 87
MDIAGRSPHGSPSDRNLRVFLWIVLLAAAAEFIVRGPVRFLRPTNWSDLAQNYAASRLWLRGQNFSNPENFVALWRNEVGAPLGANTLRVHLAPLPGALVLIAPIAVFPWPIAKLVWLAVLLTAFGLTIYALMKTAGFRFGKPRSLAFIASCLALAPFHTGFGTENQTIVVIGLCALGIWAATSGRHDVAAGLLFGAACSLKPHIGSFLVLYYLVQRRWRLFATALGFTAVLAVAGILWMQICGVSWAHDYFHNLKVLSTENQFDDFTSWNPIRFMLINLQVPFFSFTGSAKSSNILALSIGVLLISMWIYLILRRRSVRSELLALGAIGVIGLLPVYHRLYDASILAIPLAWCIAEISGDLKNISRAALLLMAPFLVPGTAVLQQLAIEGRIPTSWINSWWWDRVVMPHQTWLLLLISLVLLYGLNQKRRESAQGANI